MAENSPKRVCVTGGAGFIGSHICDRLVEMGTEVVCVDNLITGSIENISHLLGKENFEFFEHDITEINSCMEVMEGCDAINHQAALGSVPRSVADPLKTNLYNITGTLNIFHTAATKNIRRVVFASSSSVYGDEEGLPKLEGKIGSQLSPYAVSKRTGELYSAVFNKIHGIETIGLRYFNIFGPRQTPEGVYAAVIPRFIKNTLNRERSTIFGDGGQSRDFTYVSNAVDANIAALTTDKEEAFGRIYNIACGSRMTLNEIFEQIRDIIGKVVPEVAEITPIFEEERVGDVRHSLADISLAKEYLDYDPIIDSRSGLSLTVQSHITSQ